MADTKNQPQNSVPETDGALFSYSYEITNPLVQDAASALAGEKGRNPAAGACAAVLLVIILTASFPRSEMATPLLVVLLVLEVGLWNLMYRWQDVQLGRLRKAGFDTALIDHDKRRRKVRIYEDRILVDDGETTKAHLMSDAKKPRMGSGGLVIPFRGGGFVLVPAKSLSTSRYGELVAHLNKLTGSKLSI